MKMACELMAVVEADERDAGVEGPVLEAAWCQIKDGDITAERLEAVMRFSNSNHVTLLR